MPEIKQLGEFKVTKQLGEGGMGCVLLGYQESLDRQVALKVLSESLCKNEKFIARFKREARSAASLVHPNVIQIYSIGEDDGIHFFAMEYIRGKDIAELVEEGRRFSLDEILDIVAQVAEALACGAEQGIIHRDIKPANIMLTDKGMVKVTDFGLAKTISSELDVTEAGTIVGTANYMSPEQGQGKPLDVRTDIYSLGVVLFELLAGRVPFIADQTSAVLYMHVFEPPPPPSRFNPDVPAAVDRMVHRMLSKDPDERPANPTVLLSELHGLKLSLGGGMSSPAASRSGQLQPPKIGEDASDSVARTPSVVGLAAVPVGSLKALIADDMASVRKLYKTLLTEMGFGVVEAVDGAEAIELWRKEKPALILLDINMPKMRGDEVLAVKADEKLSGEVIVISARKDRETVAAAASKGICTYLTKPININEMRDRIQRVMSLPGAKAAIRDVQKTSIEPASPQQAAGMEIVVYDVGTYARTLYRGVLENLGHQVACVDSVNDVRKIIAEGAPGLLIMAISREDAGALSLLEEVRSGQPDLAVILIVDENDTVLRSMDLQPILSKPVRLDEFRKAVVDVLEGTQQVEKPANRSDHFTCVVNRQLAHDQAFTIYDFGREIAGVLPSASRKSFESRLTRGSKREVETAITNLLKRLRDDGKLELGMRYVRYAYMHGDLGVRNFCLALLPEIMQAKEETEILLKVITDEDFRVRCQVIQRLGQLRSSEAVPTIVRFLNDDVWKVRKEAASCLLQFDLIKVIEPLFLFYARSGESLPQAIRQRLLSNTGTKEFPLLEQLIRSGGVEVRVYVAEFLGELRSKLAVRPLMELLRDKSSRVRSAAARSAGAINNEKLRESLFLTLTDANSEVQAAAVEGLLRHKLTPAASVMLAALGGRKRRIGDNAVRFVAQLNSSDNSLDRMLQNIDRQSPDCRKYLSLLLSFILTGEGELDETVRLLNAGDSGTRRQGMEKIFRSINEFLRSL